MTFNLSKWFKKGAGEDAEANRPPRGPARDWNSLVQQADGLYQRGDARSLETAISLYREVLRLVSRESSPVQWALIQNDFGNALSALGETESGAARLRAAQAAYEQALTVRTLETYPIDWALTACNLGGVLIILGKRENETNILRRAVEVLQEVADFSDFMETEKGSSPLNVAAIYDNLAISLKALGEFDSSESGVVLLSRGLAAYEKALAASGHGSRHWAMIQSNYGLALQRFGERTNDVEVLKKAVAAQRAALEFHPPERFPRDWALDQQNFAGALAALGKREAGTKTLESAVQAYRLVTERKDAGLDKWSWALAQSDLGVALIDLARRENSQSRLNEALAAFRAALTVFDPSSAQWQNAQTGIKAVEKLRERMR